jgi:hypothetical protein
MVRDPPLMSVFTPPTLTRVPSEAEAIVSIFCSIIESMWKAVKYQAPPPTRRISAIRITMDFFINGSSRVSE